MEEELLAKIAFGIGFVQMYADILSADSVDIGLKKSIIIGIISSTFWLIYQYSKYGLNITTTHTTLGLAVQLYILNKILMKETNKVKE